MQALLGAALVVDLHASNVFLREIPQVRFARAFEAKLVPLVADDQNVHYLNAEISGMFVPTTEHWNAVREGELLGRIVSPLRGDVLSEVRSPVCGVLFTLREYPLVYEGSRLARIMRVERRP